jgi:stringent starvation protein B
MYAWIVDSGHTPHVVVDAAMEGVEVPRQFVQDGRIVLNISPSAVGGLAIGNEALEFSARFSGTAFSVRVPVAAVLGIYARETGRGMIFSAEEPAPTPEEPPPEPGNGAPAPRKGHLKIVK